MAMDNDEGLSELARELENDEYPLPEEKKEEKQVTYKNVDVTIEFRKESRKDSITDEKRVLFTDSGFGVDKLLYDEDRAILRVPIVLAKEMVYHYDDYDAFRPRTELEAIASYIKGVPVTRGHPEEKIVTDRGEVLGWAVDAEFEDDELRVVLEISDKSLVEDIRSGKLSGVSPGHFSRLDKTSSGEYEGTHYDLTQRDIFIDHIAIVEEGRCSRSDGCGIVVDAEVKEDKELKKKEGDEEVMEPKVVEKKVGAAMVVAEGIEKKAEEETAILKDIIDSKEEVPAAIVSKAKKVLNLAEKIGEEAKGKLVEELEQVKEAVTGMKDGEMNEDPESKKKERDAKLETDAAISTLEAERDELRAELDEIVSVEKGKLVDELGTLQDVKSGDELKEMSLDSLKSDLKLVKALRGIKFTVGDDGSKEGGSAAIKSAYTEVGKKGGKG